jgi:hypothetical protein
MLRERFLRAAFGMLYRSRTLYWLASTIPFAGNWRVWQRRVLERITGNDVLEIGPGIGYLFADMVRAGTELALGSDAPVSPVDPWGAIRVAVERTGDRRPSWHPEQALTLSQAITASTRHVTQVVTGGPGDVIAVAHNPFDLSGDALAGLTSDLTVVGGEVTAAAL